MLGIVLQKNLQGPINGALQTLGTKASTPRPHAIYWVVSLSLAGVLLWYSLQGIEWARVWQIVKGAHPNLSILSHDEIPTGARVVSLGLIQ